MHENGIPPVSLASSACVCVCLKARPCQQTFALPTAFPPPIVHNMAETRRASERNDSWHSFREGVNPCSVSGGASLKGVNHITQEVGNQRLRIPPPLAA